MKFMEFLVEKPNPESIDYLCLVYYLLLQERINEAVKIF